VYAIENVVAHALKTHHYQEIKSKVSKTHSTNSNTYENNRNKTNGKAKHFIINDKGHVLHFNCQQLIFVYKNCKEELLE
jgi:hypothetical protein